MEPATEDALWRASLAGDGRAFGAVFDLHHARVYRHACRLVEGPPEAEDVTAAAFLELWRRRASVRLVEGSVLPWLLVTASNVARNQRRALRRYRAFLDGLPRSVVQPDVADVAFADGFGGIGPDLRAALGSLGAQDLALIALVVLEDLPLDQAGAVLGLSPSAAKSRLHRARGRLRAGLPSPRPDPSLVLGEHS